MILKELSMTNFMPYVQTMTVRFDGSQQSNVTIFGGQNGNGKSSILHAIRWCLYGETRVNKKSKSVDLLLNKKSKFESEASGVVAKMQVRLSWNTNGKDYELTRFAEYNPVTKKFTMNATMRVDDDVVIPEMAIPAKVREFLPQEISHLFLFDGESQREFDDMAESTASAAFIKAEIENTLSIPFIKKAIKEVNAKSNTESQSVKKIEKEAQKASTLRQELNQSIQYKLTLDSAYEEALSKYDEVNQQLNEIEDALGDVEAFQRLQNEIDVKRQELKSKREEIRLATELLRDSLKSSLWLPATQKLSEISDVAQNSANKNQVILNSINTLKASIQLHEDSKHTTECSLCGSKTEVDIASIDEKINKLRLEIENLQKLTTNSHEDSLLNLNRIGFNANQVQSFRKQFGVLQQQQAKYSEVETDLLDLEQSKGELSTGAADTDVLLSSHTALSKKASFYHSEISRLSEKRQSEDAKQANIKTELLKVGTMSPEKRKMLTALTAIEAILNSALNEYSDLARESVESKASETSKFLNNDPKWLGIKITDTFGAQAIDEYGAAQLTNTATKKIVAISLVDGLIRTAMADGFILMDSPTGSLDQPNRANFAKWAANSHIQVSIFVHDGEFDLDREREFFGTSIGRIYSIEKISDNESLIKEIA